MVNRQGPCELEFRFFRPNAHEVYLVGDFNHWNEQATPMTKSADGAWVTQMKLPCGIYQFRYLADGQWFTDYAAFGLECCPHGFNSVVMVAETSQPACFHG